MPDVAQPRRASRQVGARQPESAKAIGQTYQSRNQLLAKAIPQFQSTLQLQPTDIEAHQGLLACYDRTGKKTAATLELLAMIDIDRHNLALYQQLADRFKDNEAEAELRCHDDYRSRPA